MINKKEYLGDSVYINWDGFLVVLTTENGDSPLNVIMLEPEVIEKLENYLLQVKDFVKNYKQIT